MTSGRPIRTRSWCAAPAGRRRRAVQALVARKLRRMLALAERMLGDAAEAEDVAQEVFFRVWRHAPTLAAGRGPVRHLAAPGDAATSATTACGAAARGPWPSRRRRPTPARRPIAACRPRTSAGGCEAAMQALPPRQREAIVLCHYQELGNIEAART